MPTQKYDQGELVEGLIGEIISNKCGSRWVEGCNKWREGGGGLAGIHNATEIIVAKFSSPHNTDEIKINLVKHLPTSF